MLQRPGVRSPISQPPRTRSGSTSDKENVAVLANSTFQKTPTNKSLLQTSLLKNAGLHSPLATSLSESETSDDSEIPSKPKIRVIKSKCPCGTSSEGASWLMTCKTCGQVWHSKCSNLDGPELTQGGVDSLLPQWDCPWCFTCPFPRPKGHKSAKLDSTLQTTCYANKISAEVTESLEGMVERTLAKLTEPTNLVIEAIQNQLSELTKNIASLQGSQPNGQTHAHTNPIPPNHQQPGPPSLPPVTTGSVNAINLKHATKHIEELKENYITEEEERELMLALESEEFVSEGERAVIQYGEHYKYMGSRTKPKAMPAAVKKIMDSLNSNYASKHREQRFHYSLNSCLVNRYSNNSVCLPEHSDNEGDIDPKSSILTLSLGAPRHLNFRDLQSGDTTSILCKGRSPSDFKLF